MDATLWITVAVVIALLIVLVVSRWAGARCRSVAKRSATVKNQGSVRCFLPISPLLGW